MALPILLPLMGLAIAGKFGMDWMAGEEEESRASTMLGALRSARTAVPGSEVGETGPELPEYRTDWGMVGEKLLEAGDPAGLSLAMSAATARSEAEAKARASELEHRRDMEKTRYKEEEAWKRQTRTLNAQQQKDAAARQAGFMPTYHAPGTEGWAGILEEGTSLKYAGGILRDFQAAMASYGTESWGELSGQLSSKREQLMLFLKEGEETGAIDAGTVELFERMLPDVTALSGDLLNVEAGKLNALIDLFNSKYIPAYNAKAMYTSDVPTVGLIQSEENVPEGYIPVDAGMMERERELMRALDREQRQRAGYGVDYSRQRQGEADLDELTRRAQAGQLMQRR